MFAKSLHRYTAAIASVQMCCGLVVVGTRTVLQNYNQTRLFVLRCLFFFLGWELCPCLQVDETSEFKWDDEAQSHTLAWRELVTNSARRQHERLARRDATTRSALQLHAVAREHLINFFYSFDWLSILISNIQFGTWKSYRYVFVFLNTSGLTSFIYWRLKFVFLAPIIHLFPSKKNNPLFPCWP